MKPLAITLCLIIAALSVAYNVAMQKRYRAMVVAAYNLGQRESYNQGYRDGLHDRHATQQEQHQQAKKCGITP